MRGAPFRRLWLVAAVVALMAGCDHPRREAPRNLLLVVVDTLRADHLGLYAYPRDTSPNLDRLAASGVVFEQARSQAACTFPSVGSLLTSRVSAEFLGQFYGDFSIPERLTTVEEVLQRLGWATFAASASSVVRATPSRVNLKGGYGRGFERFDESCENADARCINARFLEFLETRPERFFAYLHYLEPHHPYQPPAEHARRFAREGPWPWWVQAGNPDPIERALTRHERPPVSEAELQHLVDLYDDEIAWFDEQLGRLFDALRARGLLENTVVVLAADHGEMFLAHGAVKHCRKLYDEVIRTPLVFWVPHVSGRRVTASVENLDVVPTVLDLLGVPATELHFDGRSLRAAIEGAPPSDRHYAFSAQDELRSVTDGRYKLIYDLVANRAALFDLERDPGELADRVNDLPGERDRLQHELARRLAATEGPDGPVRNVGLSREVERSLRALGYLQ
jgi:arylsulfatase A-like enzyme